MVVTGDDLEECVAASMIVRPVGIEIDRISMDSVVREMHEKNGLFAELRAGNSMQRHEAEELLVEFVNGTLGDVELDSCVNCKRKCAEHDYALVGGQGLEFLPPTCRGLEFKSFLAKRVTVASQTPFAGSTVSFDRNWLREHMPKLEGLFSYRSIDVSSVTELAKRWAPKVYENRPKAGAAHRALADVRESIATRTA
jgi:oligoribonuclease (3'-5' exoribonuclease)